MKIQLHISTDTLIAANNVLKRVYELPVSLDKRENVYKSIGFDLADTFDSKTKSKIKKASLFENKKTKLTLKYHEAWALEKILQELLHTVENDYQKSLLKKLIFTLNEETA